MHSICLSVCLFHEGRTGDGQIGAGRAEGGAEGRATAGEAPPVVARLRPLSAAPQGHLARRDEVSTNVMSCSTGMNVEIWNLAEILDIGIGSVHPACKVSEVALLVRPVNFCL